MNRYFVFSDVHGEYDALVESLQAAGYDDTNPKHFLVSLGDNFDRGSKSREIFNFLQNRKAICVKGNHDCFLEEFVDKGSDGEFVIFNILHNGLSETLKSFSNVNTDMFTKDYLDRVSKDLRRSTLATWLHKMPMFFETKNYIFCHAGINPSLLNWKDTDEDYLLWDIQDSHKNLPYVNKNVVIGHHHAEKVRRRAIEEGIKESNLQLKYVGATDDNRPYRYKNKIAIDTMTNLTHKVNVLIIDDEPVEEVKKEEEKYVNNNDGSTITIKSDGTIIGTYTTGDYTNFTYTIPDPFYRV